MPPRENVNLAGEHPNERVSSPRQLSHPEYRPDIDGLRAVAVLSVVAYHAFPAVITGGFIGVDIFFIISGFLISGILFDNLAAGSFSFAGFYRRRITRIFPALILVLATSLLLGYWLLLGDEFRQLGKHTAAGAGFVSNLILWQETGYFDNLAQTKPLLHLWSLGIEEQFYLAWPLWVYLACKRKLRLAPVVGLTAAASFAWNIASLPGSPEAVFYSPFTRLWELAAGGVLALRLRGASSDMFSPATASGESGSSGAVDVLALTGATLVAAGILVVDETMVFPGWWALLPTVGAFLLISAGPRAWFNRTVLANRIMVWFGLISYPLYLWHWPLLTFARIVSSGTPGWSTRVAIVMFAVVLAWLTYRFVETPIRSRQHGSAMAGVLCVLTLAVGSAGFAVYRYGPVPDTDTTQLSSAQLSSAEPHTGTSGVNIPQFVEDRFSFEFPPDKRVSEGCRAKVNIDIGSCRLQDVNASPTVALIGDSHAPVIFDAIAPAVAESGGSLVLVGKGGCPPFLHVERIDMPGCAGILQQIVNYVTTTASIRTVVLAARFTATASGADYGVPTRPGFYALRHESDPAIIDREAIFRAGLGNMITALESAGIRVIVVLNAPELEFDPRSCLAERGNHSCVMDWRAVEARQAGAKHLILSVLSGHPGATMIELAPYFCQEAVCLAKVDGHILYSDNHHIGLNGAAWLYQKGFTARIAALINGNDAARDTH